jgi:predicted small lipoprotein YifL
MKSIFLSATAFAAVLSLGACTRLGLVQPEDTVASTPLPETLAADVAVTPADPVLTSAPPPPRAANTQASLDTTTPEQRKQAAAPATPRADSKVLGSTVASLGSPTEPGFWLKTPLVTAETAGRVTNKANGKSSAVTLIPIEGPATGGSRLSLPAMRLIEAPLTDLVDLTVTLGS